MPNPKSKIENPKYSQSPRSGRLPLTLIDGSSRANIARDLAAVAASIHFRRPCYARMLQRAARQVSDSYTPAQAVANYTETPSASAAFAEAALAETPFTEASGPL